MEIRSTPAGAIIGHREEGGREVLRDFFFSPLSSNGEGQARVPRHLSKDQMNTTKLFLQKCWPPQWLDLCPAMRPDSLIDEALRQVASSAQRHSAWSAPDAAVMQLGTAHLRHEPAPPHAFGSVRRVVREFERRPGWRLRRERSATSESYRTSSGLNGQ